MSAPRRSTRSGLQNLQLSPGGGALPEKDRRFEAGLLDLRRRQGLYAENPHGVEISEGVLYRARIAIPSQVPVGTYTAETFLIDRRQGDRRRDPRHRDRQDRVRALRRARRPPPRFLYGLAAVLMSLGLGWAAACRSAAPDVALKPILTGRLTPLMSTN